MEIAFNELRNTVEQTRAYLGDKENEQHPGIMRNYIQDIVEDIAFLEKHRANFKEKEQEATELIVEARRLKRDVEKQAYVLEVAAKRKENRQSTPQQGKSSSVKLPRIKLPVFDGETGEDYRGFMDAFRDSLDLEPDLSGVKKWLLFRAQLTGKALNLVRELPTAPETYDVAVRILEDAYGSVKRAVLKLYERIQNLPCAMMETNSLRSTYAQLEGLLLSLTNLGEELDNNYFLRAVVLGKYPSELIHLLRISDETPLSAFRREMSLYVKQRDCIIQQPASQAARTERVDSGFKGGAGGSQSKKPRHNNNANSTNGGGTGTPAPPNQVTALDKNNVSSKKREPKAPCLFCTGIHWADECDKVTALDERLKFVTERCHRCLRPRHIDEACRSRRVCYYCRESAHHSALCPKQFSKVLLARGDNAVSRFVTAVLPVGNIARTKRFDARAVLDTAGGRSLITEQLAAQLELEAFGDRRVKFVGVNSVPLSQEPAVARRLALFPPRSRPIEIDVYVVPKIVDNVEATSVPEIKKQYPRYATLPMPREGNGEEVHLLLGYRCLTSVVTFHKSIFLSPTLQLLSTKFGWIPFGGLPGEDGGRLDSSVVGLLKEEDPVKLMCNLELIGLSDFTKTENEEEAVVLDKYHATIKRLGKRYEVEWPYRSDDPSIEDNFGLAFGRLASLVRQLRKTPALLAEYDRLIRAQLEEGIVEAVNSRALTRPGLVHYLPHRAVIRHNKSTPVRIVFDAAARANKTSRSLNDLIHKGGNWVNDIPGVLMRFRRYGIALTTDIVKAFHQISIAPRDRDVVRFLWLRDLTRPPSKDNLCVYRFRRMAFGVVASPFLLTATIKHHLRTFPNEFADIIERDLYADNLITSLPRSVDAQRFYHVTKNCFAEMSMALSQWATDDENLRNFFETAEAKSAPEQSLLGLAWNTQERKLGVRSPRLAEVDGPTPTKRIVLKEMATVYDPLGWVAPVVLKAKLFLRDLWRRGCEWEQPLPPSLASEWNELRRVLNQVADNALPRPYGFNGLENADRFELHAFSDASAAAYGTAIYLCVYEGDRCWSGLVAAKSRLAPSKTISIPRLELLAAVTAARFLKFVERALQLQKQTTKYLWCDAKCVIAWVASNKVLPAFVERAVASIREAGLPRLHYVPTKENPADVTSRGALMTELSAMHWWRGPGWLTNSSNWPPQGTTCEFENTLESTEEQLRAEEAKILFLHATIKLKKQIDPSSSEGAPFDLDPNHYRTTSALYRVTAVCLKAASRFLRGRGTIQSSDQLQYREARYRWLRWDQRRIYEESKSGKTNASYLKNLKASLDENGLIRCDTRIYKANLTRSQTQPILLVKKSALTKLIVKTVHEYNLHAGTSHTLAALRKQYWLPHGRREVYQILRETCHTCSRDRAQPFRTPEIAVLPEFRVNHTETPFQNVGVDVFGPYKVRIGGQRDSPVQKKWVLIFTCLIVRAIHLEILDDMTAQEFLMSFRRFAGRRGVPKLIVSDNAPQFYVVERIFRCVWRHFATAEVTQKYYAQHSIDWKFITPETPWKGGVYERLIKEVKRTFEKVYRNLTLYERQFELALIEIEGVINSRPITYVDRELETELITPNDFLRVKYPAIPIQRIFRPHYRTPR